MHETGAIRAEEREEMRMRMLGVIFPNTPVTPAEQEAFERAVQFQILHDREQTASEIPAGARMVRIGHYSVEMQENWNGGDRLSPRTLCSAAYGALLYAGLLYKGVERR